MRTPDTDERLSLEDAIGRICSEAISAPLDLPPFASSAMDGYAYAAGGISNGVDMQLVGESLAGHPFAGTVGAGECIRITTGAAVPDSTDTVIIQENCERHGDHVHFVHIPDPGQNIRTAGHDIHRGAIVCPAGKRLNPFDLGWLAACGVTGLKVKARPSIAVFSTGDELVVPGGTLADGQIFDANRQILLALLEKLPVHVKDLGILPDDEDRIRQALSKAASENDMLLTSGGVSVGDADYVKDIVEELGALELWRLNLKPGKPLAFGTIGDSLFIGLPGNPVSTIVTYLLIARPAILKMSGASDIDHETQTAQLLEPVKHNPGREEYQRGRSLRRDGRTWVGICGDQSSNRLASFSDADCLIRIPKDAGDLEGGTEVEILPFFGLVGT